MILIDANSLIVLLIGLMNPSLIKKHKRTSIYTKEDFHTLLEIIGNFENLVVLPNIWTEVDNLLNDFNRSHKYLYLKQITEIIKRTSEEYLKSEIATENHSHFHTLGLTDSLILELAKNKKCKFLITSDSELSDHALANGIIVYDMIKEKNKNLK